MTTKRWTKRCSGKYCRSLYERVCEFIEEEPHPPYVPEKDAAAS